MQMATAIESDNGDMIVKRVSVPLGLEELMEGLTKEVLLKKPRDIYIFASEYFAKLLQMREKTAFKGIPIRRSNSVVKQTKPEKLSQNNRSKTVDSSNKKYFGRQKSIREQSPSDVISSVKGVPLNVAKIDKSKSIINKHNKARKELAKNNEKDVSSRNVGSTKSTPRVTRDRSIKREGSKDGKTVLTPRQKSQENREQKIKINGRKIVSKSADKVVLSSVVKKPEVAKIAPSAIIKSQNKDKEVLDTDVKETENKSTKEEDIGKESNDVVGCKMTANDAVDLIQEEQNKITESLTEKVDRNIGEIANKEILGKNNESPEKDDSKNIAELPQNGKSVEKSSETKEKEETADKAEKIDKESAPDKKVDNKNENLSTKEKRQSSKATNKNKPNSEKNLNSEILKETGEEDTKLKEQEEEKLSENNLKNSASDNTNVERTPEETQDNLKNKKEIAQESLKETDEQILDESKKLEKKEKLLEEAEEIEKNISELNQPSFDTSKLRDELNQASTTAQSSFKTSFNPFVLRQEINKASESTETNQNEVSKIEETARQIAAAIKIQSLWRGFCDRKNIKSNTTLNTVLLENKIDDVQKQDEIKQNSEINTNGHSKMEEAAIQVAAAIKIQSLWREFSKQKNAKRILNSEKVSSENEIINKHHEKEVKDKPEINNENSKMEEAAKQIAAALKIQSLWREFLSRKNKLKSSKILPKKSKEIEPETQKVENSSEMLKMGKAVLTIQRVWRGFHVRKLKKRGELFGTTIENELKEKEDLKTHFAENKNNAARKIQSLWRGYQVRKNVDEVNKHLSDLQKPADCDELPNQRGVISDADIYKAASKIQAGYRGYVVRKKRNVNLKSITEDDEILRAIEELDEIPTEPPTKVDKTEKTVSFITSPNKKLVKTFSMDSINNKSGQIEKLKSNSLETDQNSVSYDGYIINDLSKQHSNVLATEMKRNIENICKNYDNNKSILQEHDENNANIKSEIENINTVAAKPAEYKTSTEQESISNSLNKADNAVHSLQQSEETAYEEAPTRPVTSEIIQDALHNPNLFSDDVKPEDSTSNRNNIQMENVGIGLLKDTNLNNDKLFDEDKQVLREIHKELNYEHDDDDDTITVENIQNQKRPLSLESNTSLDSVATVIFNDGSSEDKETLEEILKNEEISEKDAIDDKDVKSDTILGELNSFNKNEMKGEMPTENKKIENKETKEKANKKSEHSKNNNSANNDDRTTSITEIEKTSGEINKTKSDNADDTNNSAIQNASHLLEDNNKSSVLLEEKSNAEKVDFINEKIESLEASKLVGSKSAESNLNKMEPLLTKKNVDLEIQNIRSPKDKSEKKIEIKEKEKPEKNIEIALEKIEEKQLSKDKEINESNEKNENLKQGNKDVGDNSGDDKKEEQLNKQEEKQEVTILKDKIEDKEPIILKENDYLIQHPKVEESSNLKKEETIKKNQTKEEADISKLEDKQEETKSSTNSTEIETLNHSEVELNVNANQEDKDVGSSSKEKKQEEELEVNTLKDEIKNKVDDIVKSLILKEKNDAEVQHGNVEESSNLKEETDKKNQTNKEPDNSKLKDKTEEIESEEKQQLTNNKEIEILKHSEIKKSENVMQKDSEKKKQASLDKQEEKQEVNTLKNEIENKVDDIIEPLILEEKNDSEVQHDIVEASSNQNQETDKKNQTNKEPDNSKFKDKKIEIKCEEKQLSTIDKEIETLNHLEIEKIENAADAKQESLIKQNKKQEPYTIKDKSETKTNNIVEEPLSMEEKSDKIQLANVEKNSNLKEENNEKTDNNIQTENKKETTIFEEKLESEKEQQSPSQNNEIHTLNHSSFKENDNLHQNENETKTNEENKQENKQENKTSVVEPLFVKENINPEVQEKNENLKQTEIGDNDERKSKKLLNTEKKPENTNANLKKIESIDDIDQNTETNNKLDKKNENNDDIISKEDDKNKKENNENNKSSENVQINNTGNVSFENAETNNDFKNMKSDSNEPIKTSEKLEKNPKDIINKNKTKNNNNTNDNQQETSEKAEEVKINNITLHESNKIKEKPINIQNNEEENNLVEQDAKTVDNNNTLPTEDEHNSEIENTSNNETLNATKIAHKNNDDQDLSESSTSSIINKTLDPGTSNNDSNNKTQGNNNKNNSSSISSNEDNKIKSITDETQVMAHSQIINDSKKNNAENVLKSETGGESETDQEKNNKFNLSSLQKEIQDCGKEKHAKLNTKLLNQEIDDSDKKFKESVIAGVKPDYYKQDNKNDDVELKINENVKSMASGNEENNKLNVDKLQNEIFENINKSEFSKSSSEELLDDNNDDEFYIPIRELSDIKEEEGETKQFNDDEAEETPKSSSLVHSSELSDSLSYPAVVTPPGRNSSRDGECQTEPLVAAVATPGLVNTGEFHDNVLPVSVQLNEGSPAGPAVLTSEMSKSINNGISGQDKAQASSKDASTCETQPDNVSPLPISSMETEKRNNASLPAKKNMEAEAATKIQAGFRGYQVRKQMKSKKTAPGDISNQRRSARRKSSGRLTDSARNTQQKSSKQPQPSDLEEKSAVKIQAGVRGFLVRRRQKKQKGDDEDDESS